MSAPSPPISIRAGETDKGRHGGPCIAVAPPPARWRAAAFALLSATWLLATDADAASSSPERRRPPPGLYAHDVRAPEGADDTLQVRARFTSAGRDTTAFVPLLVISDAQGRERREGYAESLRLRRGESSQVSFQVDVRGLEPGRYFLAVLPSHPATGKRMGKGVYRVPLKIRCCGPGGARTRP